jgi:RNA polymerase sigma-70 factor (ECF subfamily)
VTSAEPGPRQWHLGPSDEEIVEQVRGGQTAAYEILMRRHNQRVYRAVRAILGDQADVEDVMQDAYLAAFRHLGSFAGRARFSTWLVRIAVNCAVDRFRQAGRFVSFDPMHEEALAPEIGMSALAGPPDPEQQACDRELVGLLESAIARLPPVYRVAYVLREVEGLSPADAAECLGIEEATFKTRVHRARLRLREALGRDAGTEVSSAFRFDGERCDRVVAGVLAKLG